MTFWKMSSCVRSVCSSTTLGPEPVLMYRTWIPRTSAVWIGMPGAHGSWSGRLGGRPGGTDMHQRNQANDCNYRDRADMHVRTTGPAAEAKHGLLPISRDVQEHLLLACYKARLPSDDHDRHRTCPLARAQAPSYG